MSEAGYELVVAFPDEGPSFTHGFEAGLIWAALTDDFAAAPPQTIHAENEEVVRRMAAATQHEVTFEPSGTEGWLVATFRHRPIPGPDLRLVPGGLAG